MHFLAELWRSGRRPRVLRRTVAIALAVGTILTAINLGDAIALGAIDNHVRLKIALNYIVPFVVSNLGAMSSQ